MNGLPKCRKTGRRGLARVGATGTTKPVPPPKIRITKVLVDRGVLANFRRRAILRAKLNPPQEYIEAPLGKIASDGKTGEAVETGTALIQVIHPVEHTADASTCYYASEELDSVLDDAGELGLDFLGTIHTHVGVRRACVHLSTTDRNSAVEDSESISAVLFVKRTRGHIRTELSIEVPVAPIEIRITN